MESHIKELLRRDGVKLWLPPYTVEGLRSGLYPTDMLDRYGRETNKSPIDVEQCLEKIRIQAVARLEANKTFASTGLATLYVSKISSSSDDEANSHKAIECRLSDLGKEFRNLVAEAFSISPDDFKLIGQARVIEDNRLLDSQGVSHGADILCVLLTDDEKKSQQEQQWRSAADLTRDAVRKLTKNESLEFSQLQITDQHGKPVQLPFEEREALSLAMALHDKGRKALKSRNYGQALLLLLEADKEFELCRSDILQMVDNYAILCLDIVWCYLRLHSVNSLPDAERRLRLADEGFRRSYGPNFERLAKIRKGVLYEKALIIRLKLLQGALAYYQRKYRHAHEYFISVARDIKALEVDDTKLSQLMSMGYSATEARLGLRACDGVIEAAVQHIIEERENEAQREKERERQYREQMLQQRFGKTPSGKSIDPDLYDKIVGMGFRKRAAGEALRQAENDMNVALEILRVLPSTQSPGDELVDSIEDSLFDQTSAYSLEQLTFTISSLGFSMDAVQEAIRLHPQDLVGAMEALLGGCASSPLQTLLASNVGFRDSIMRLAHKLQEHQRNRRRRRRRRTGSQPSTTQAGQAAGAMQNEEEVDEDQAAFNQLEGDISHSLHEHLDTTFEEELQVLEMLHPLVIPHLQ